MLNIGLTGGIGSGKSAVSSALAELGATIIDADRIAREVLEPGTEGLELVVREFGSQIVDSDGALDRAALAAIVFNDDGARERLNRIVHPRVRARSQELVDSAGPDAVLVHDIPLLAEGTMAPSFHLVVIVVAPLQTRLQRLVETRGMDRADALARIEAQATDEQRLQIADVVLDNSGTIEQLGEQVSDLWAERLSPYAAALELKAPAVDRLTAREGAAERELARVRWALYPLGVEAHPAQDRVLVGEGDERVLEALNAAGYFGWPMMRSADPGGVLHLELPEDSDTHDGG